MAAVKFKNPEQLALDARLFFPPSSLSSFVGFSSVEDHGRIQCFWSGPQLGDEPWFL